VTNPPSVLLLNNQWAHANPRLVQLLAAKFRVRIDKNEGEYDALLPGSSSSFCFRIIREEELTFAYSRERAVAKLEASTRQFGRKGQGVIAVVSKQRVFTTAMSDAAASLASVAALQRDFCAASSAGGGSPPHCLLASSDVQVVDALLV
jgi:hypothetical protein